MLKHILSFLPEEKNQRDHSNLFGYLYQQFYIPNTRQSRSFAFCMPEEVYSLSLSTSPSLFSSASSSFGTLIPSNFFFVCLLRSSAPISSSGWLVWIHLLFALRSVYSMNDTISFRRYCLFFAFISFINSLSLSHFTSDHTCDELLSSQYRLGEISANNSRLPISTLSQNETNNTSEIRAES